MTAWWIGILVAIGALWGYGLGTRRLAILFVGSVAAALVTPRLAPMSARTLAVAFGWDAWLGDACCWAATYVAAGSLVAAIVARLWRRSSTAPSRFGGAFVGGASLGLAAWIVLGNFADLTIEHLPTESAVVAGTPLRRPLEVLRACRLLASLDHREAEFVVGHPDVQAVLQARSFQALVRAPGMIGKFSRASDGDWTALATLAADPEVKRAMNEPEFLRRVRAVDVVRLAADVERLRTETTESPISTNDRDASQLALQSIEFGDPALRARLAAEWFDSPSTEEVTEAAPAGGVARIVNDPEAYWSTVGTALELFDRPRGPAWVPHLFAPMLDARSQLPAHDDAEPAAIDAR